MKVSVIMASFLHQYPGSTSNPEKKFIRAVNSFISQTYENKELIIVSDGCDITIKLYIEYFSNNSDIKLVTIPKQPLYGSETRDAGLRIATGDIICYLDSDDVIGKQHLKTIMENFTDDIDWAYYDDFLVKSNDFKKLIVRHVEPRYGSIGTSSLVHRNFLNNPKYSYLNSKPHWFTCYGHDWLYIVSLSSKGLKFKKLEKTPQYLVCHWGGQGDF
jgi:glycosyltransferase involved in cell wall biosynthesis